jgi:hypothetical protein
MPILACYSCFAIVALSRENSFATGIRLMEKLIAAFEARRRFGKLIQNELVRGDQ